MRACDEILAAERGVALGLPLVVVTGPTAAGKSDFAMQLAHRLNGVVINGDAAQLYTPLNIGTAKPRAWRILHPEHRLFDVLSAPVDYNVMRFRGDVLSEIIRARGLGRVPIVVGGSQFYLLSLFFPPRVSCSGGEIRTELEKEACWEELARRDMVRAREIHPHDHYRISRALQLLNAGVIASSIKPLFVPVDNNFFIIEISRERDDLYERINRRVLSMLADGWLHEVKNLSLEWQSFVLRKRFIGYSEILHDAVSGALSPSQACIDTICRSTRRYAKRQMTFWRSFMRKIEAHNPGVTTSYNLTLHEVDLYVDKAVQFVSMPSQSLRTK